MGTATPSSEDPIRALLRAAHHLPATGLGAVVTGQARRLGAREAVVYLADYAQHVLVPVPGEGVPGRQELTIDGSVAGRAFRRVDTVQAPAQDGLVTLWVPLLDGAERVGVLEFVVPGEVPPELDDDARTFASLVAEVVVTRDAYSDFFSQLRRRRTLSLAAEIQWDLLPPLTYASDRVVVTGALEPAYEIGGDTFDYAVNGSLVDLMVLDAVGHGLPAALLSSAAVGGYRHARRRGLDLPGIAAAVDAVVAGQFSGSRFATAAIARLDLDTGVLHWVNCGHPDPLLVRDGTLVRPPACRPGRPLGLQSAEPDVCQVQLRPGDRVLLYTDGVVEARSPGGEFFGEERLADLVVRAELAGDPPPETMRRLMGSVMNHQAGQLQDDASIVMVEWRTGREEQLQP
ncbi:serine phosphatase RsbU (regulator of sigma subunit) [Geodermatophilus bullaregiensis]|uniref:PP2C family protein-serine/threonine phosphatase n=1 Tax=Geodermatophilus bullaregiensis TaxID=1564160 RepID=UPI0027DB74DC|nr:PP2C family protein-serine/threonine phosphatase [Geodermatophilus bullaregiensis]MBM7807617.1 serine phosphatase RsbU (regulator of sigma subunit) [Geodermatophilus bullaregiensis]